MAIKTDLQTETTDAAGQPEESLAPFSVFEGLVITGVTDRMIAEFCGISVDHATAWRKGRKVVPLGKVMFLTKLLSHLIDELLKTYSQWGPAPKAWHLHMKTCLEKALSALGRQEAENKGLPEGALQQGEGMFAEWLEKDSAKGWASEAANRVALGLDTTGLA